MFGSLARFLHCFGATPINNIRRGKEARPIRRVCFFVDLSRDRAHREQQEIRG